jgi:hypothetical protein
MNKLRFIIILPAIMIAGSALAERTFRWVDNEGQVHYGNRVPPEYAKAERRVINEQGRTIQVYEAAKTPEERAAARAAAEVEARRKALDEKQAIHDRSLLATYATEQDMQLARDGKVASVEALLQLTNSRIESMKLRLLDLTEEAATYERSGKRLPHSLEDQIKNLRTQIARNEEFVKEKELELSDIQNQFDADINRFIELTAERENTESSSKRIANLEAAKNNPDIELTRHDRTLLTTYNGEEDLMVVRDQKLDAVNELIALTTERLESMQVHFSELSDNADEYESRGQKMPEVLLGQMKNVMQSIAQSEELLALKLKEKAKLEEQYSADIERYRQLTASN